MLPVTGASVHDDGVPLGRSPVIGSAELHSQPHIRVRPCFGEECRELIPDAGTVPSQATPDSIAAVAESFVGKAWNQDGCWVLASTIAAEAGTSLPLVGTAIGLPGQSNGEWIVAFNGPAGQSGNWQPMVKAGEMIVIGTQGGGGHITTCVSGSGSSAMLVDNITYVNQSGQVVNSANDGSSNDVIVAAPHPASQEWAGVQASSVVIYELDTPVVSTSVASDTVDSGAEQALTSLFSAIDPGGKAITSWQVYDTNAGDRFSLNGSLSSAHSPANALTIGSLWRLDLVSGAVAGSDTLAWPTACAHICCCACWPNMSSGTCARHWRLSC